MMNSSGQRRFTSHLCTFESREEEEEEARQEQQKAVFSAPLHLSEPTAQASFFFSSVYQCDSSPGSRKHRKQRNKKRSILSRLSVVWIIVPTLSIYSATTSTISITGIFTEAISIVHRHSLLQTLKTRPYPLFPKSIDKEDSNSKDILDIINEARRLRKEKLSNHVDSTTTATVEQKSKTQSNDSISFLSSSALLPSLWSTLFDESQDYDLERSTRDGLLSCSRLQKDKESYFESDVLDMELHLQQQAAKVRAIAASSDEHRLSAIAIMDLCNQDSLRSLGHGNYVTLPSSRQDEMSMSLSSNSMSFHVATAVLSREQHQLQQQKLQQIQHKQQQKVKSLKQTVGNGKSTPSVSQRVIMGKDLHLKNHEEKRRQNHDSKNRNSEGDNHAKKSSNARSSSTSKDIQGNNVPSEIPHEENNKTIITSSTKQNARQNDMTDAVHYRISHDEEIQLSRIIHSGVELHSLKSKFEEEHGRDITRQEWAELAKLESPKQLRRMVSDYRMAKNKLVMANMGLVHAVVRSKMGIVGGSGKDRVHKSGISYEEMVQEGSLGLLRAAELFDPSRGLRFSTYATIWIKGMLSNSNISETIKVPLREKNKWNKIQSTISELQQEFGSNDSKYKPSDEAIAERSGMDVDTVKDVMEKMKNTKNILSLDYQYETQSRSGGDVNTFEALQNDKNLMDDVDLVERLHVRSDVIAAIVKNLDRREAQLMCLRYGLNDGRTRSIKECAEEMGISQSRAQQLAVGCLKKLREADDAESLHEYLLSIA
mmetsp:Transcript_7621/g.14422  ORF Transcript_7621/g.14422 Transcript_7621/m.14422 type:complete len:768 (-) Transcript_7621:101-2404(-)